MRTIEEIEKVLKSQTPQLQNRFGVKSLGIFGSYLRGGSHPDSDIDILVEYRDTPDLIEFIALENYLSDLLHIRTDLVMRDALKERIREKVLNEVVEI